MKRLVRRSLQGLQCLKRGVRWSWRHRLRLGVLAMVFALVAPRSVKRIAGPLLRRYGGGAGLDRSHLE